MAYCCCCLWVGNGFTPQTFRNNVTIIKLCSSHSPCFRYPLFLVKSLGQSISNTKHHCIPMPIILLSWKLPLRWEIFRTLDCEYNEIIISEENNAYVQVSRWHPHPKTIKIVLSKNHYKIIFQHCLGPGIPSVHIVSLPDNTCLTTLDTNEHVHYQVTSH